MQWRNGIECVPGRILGISPKLSKLNTLKYTKPIFKGLKVNISGIYININ